MIEELNVVKTDFFLKLTSEADMATVLSAFYDDEGNLVGNTADYAIDVVGVLQEPTGNTLTSDGMYYPEMSSLDGWHVNIRLLTEAMQDAVETLDNAHGVTPSLPQRTWL